MTDHVLLIEDNFTLRRLYARTLKRDGFKVSQAEDLANARQKLREHIYDVIVCDIHLTDGLATELLVERHWRNVPVLAMSSDDSYRITCDSLGLAAFMQKPVPTRTLEPRVLEIINSHRAKRTKPA